MIGMRVAFFLLLIILFVVFYIKSFLKYKREKLDLFDWISVFICVMFNSIMVVFAEYVLIFVVLFAG
jgi:hypothetical protein